MATLHTLHTSYIYYFAHGGYAMLCYCCDTLCRAHLTSSIRPSHLHPIRLVLLATQWNFIQSGYSVHVMSCHVILYHSQQKQLRCCAVLCSCGAKVKKIKTHDSRFRGFFGTCGFYYYYYYYHYVVLVTPYSVCVRRCSERMKGEGGKKGLGSSDGLIYIIMYKPAN